MSSNNKNTFRQQERKASGKSAGTRPSQGNTRPLSTVRTTRDYLMMIRERWIAASFCALIVAGSLAAFQLQQPEVFEAESTLLFEPAKNRVVDIPDVVDNSVLNDARLDTHIEQIRSASFLEYTAESFTEEQVGKIRKPYLSLDESRPSPSVTEIIFSNITIEIRRGTYVMSIFARHRDPEAAALIADQYARKYIDFHLERNSEGNHSAIIFLRAQADQLRERVEEAENKIQEYRRSRNLGSLEENHNILFEHLSGLNRALIEARVQRIELDTQWSRVAEKLETENDDLLEIAAISGYGVIPELLRERNTLRAERDRLEQRYFENHPRMQENEGALKALNELLAENIQAAVADLRNRHKSVVQHEQKLLNELNETEKKAIELDEIAIQYNVLARQAETERESYARILNRLNETTIASQLENNINIKIMDRAWVPTKPVSPDLLMVLFQSAFLAGMVFIGVPLGRGLLDNRLKAFWEVESCLGHPLIGEVPRVTGVSKKDRPHLILSRSEHPAGESFRGLFSHLELTSSLEYPRTYLVTSTVAGEGKTFLSNNLAATFAAHGKKTLLVDCDFRRPSLHLTYARKNDAGIMKWIEKGSEHFSSPIEDKSLGIVSVGPNFALLRAGGESRNPTPLFEKWEFAKLFEELDKHYDIIIIDTPPVGMFPDALLLSRVSDEVLYGCKFNSINKTQIRKVIEKLEGADANISGIILNNIPTGWRSTNYDYYGYGNTNTKSYKAYYRKAS